MKVWVGVTDWDWYDHLRVIGASEVNFWQPNPGRPFRVLERGGPFLFKSHYDRGNLILGAGFYSGWAQLSLSDAWDYFGETNGCATAGEMRARIAKYRRAQLNPDEDPQIGCVMLYDVRFFSAGEAPAAPPGWAPNIVQGRSYSAADVETTYLEEILRRLVGDRDACSSPDFNWGTSAIPGPVFSGFRPVAVRVGQKAFKVLVRDAYERRCAITGERIVPVLEAAHIRPVAESGENRLDNGLLLRSDVHTLFDHGYLGIHPDKRTLMVSPKIRTLWGNGEEFYARAATGEPVRQPARSEDRPNREFLLWHADTRFRT